MKAIHAVAFASLLLAALPSCSKKEPKAEEVVSTQGETIPEVGEKETTASGSRLRDRMKVSKPAEEATPEWSTAETVEERRASLERALATGKEPYLIDLHDLGGWEVDLKKEQPIPDYILALDGKEVIVRGFMMPDIDLEFIQKFHLVRSLYSCCFGAPPQLNEILRVSLADKNGMDYTFKTIEVQGVLRVKFEMVDGLVEDIFRMEDATHRAFSYFDDPDAPESFDAATDLDGVVPKKD